MERLSTSLSLHDLKPFLKKSKKFAQKRELLRCSIQQIRFCTILSGANEDKRDDNEEDDTSLLTIIEVTCCLLLSILSLFFGS
jgi:hypothetical protein